MTAARIRSLSVTLVAIALGLGGLALPATAPAAAGPALKPALTALPSNLAPGHGASYLLVVTNVGAAPTSGQITLQVTVPGVLQITGAKGKSGGDLDPYSPSGEPSCTIAAQLVTCQSSEPLHPGWELQVKVDLAVSAGAQPGPVLAEASAGGGGAPTVATTAPAEISSSPLPFDFLGPLSAPLTEADGAPTTQAGSHPYQYTVGLRFPVAEFEVAGEEPLVSSADPARDLIAELPAGLIADPAATPVRCTEAELTGDYAIHTTDSGCPPASQVGVISITTSLGSRSLVTPIKSPLYNMVPPPGAPAELAFDAAKVGIYVHLIGGVRSDGDYGAYTETSDVLALGIHPLLGAQAEIWGDPSSAAHEQIRGERFLANSAEPCIGLRAPCPVPDQSPAFLTAPAACPGAPLISSVRADSWAEPGAFKSSSYESADLLGTPVAISGCNSLGFEPTISARPTTDLADSPSGLHLDLHLPTDLNKAHRSPAPLRDASVTLPPGMVANPSLADGLAGCSEAQIGYLAGDAEPGVHFSKAPNSCPDAARLGSVRVTTPLLAEYKNGETELETDPETGEPILRPLPGALYLAQPFQNPFGSLLALYLTVEDPRTGTVAKLAGEVKPDPETGQLTTTFRENPQLPIEDIHLEVFGGARGALITPPTCGTHTNTTDLVPWSAPEGADAHPQSSFQTTAEPGGGSCPATEAAAPHAPSFTAGTLSPQAGAYSPFVLKLSREDGSQRISGIDTTLPEGLTGKLAGIAECSEVQIARAASRSGPEEGILERTDPSCPASSEVGIVNVGAGAGPDPIYAQGHAYLAGPYKGAPVSLAVIVPAIAGPFDLGTVVSRVALRVEPETAQIHAVSDPLPQILDGIPLDVRSIALKMDRPDFTLNPTSCDPMSILGAATSALGQAAPLTSPFQVGGCQALPFKPKLSLRLKGSVKRSSNPTLIAHVTAKPGEANVAAAQVKLPHAVFLDQAHIRTICTRVQFAADTCPPGSVYGQASATTPLLGYPLAGPVYLRSSNHNLPDLVAKLKGPLSQPIEVDLVGKTDAVKAALRNTFEAVPDAPVSSFRLELFGGKRGLVEMSDGFCAARKANVQLTGQNGKAYDTRPVVGAKCPKHRKHKKHGKHSRSAVR